MTEAQAELALQARVQLLLAQAKRHEPLVTPLLQRLSAEVGGRMVGLEYRLKSESSTTRKLKKLLSEDPQLSVETVSIYDALRYTIEVADEPKGQHVKAIQAVLKGLEVEGFKVLTVKNYWTPNDNYSGVNVVLQAADGFDWELQLHTPASVAESRRSHKLYEELRDEATTLERKRELFKEMSAPWDTIPIPDQILTEKNLHPTELIKVLPSP